MSLELPEECHEKNFRYRASYRRRGNQQNDSHLKLTRDLKHAFQSAALPLSYSNGYHPKPEISFGPPLPMNVPSCEEFLDFLTYSFVPPEEIVSKLNAAAVPGVTFLQASQISKSSRSLASLISGADYSVDACSAEAVDAASVYADERKIPAELAHRTAVEEFLRLPEIAGTKFKTGKVINIKEFVRGLTYDPVAHRVLIEMKIIDGATASIFQVIKALYGTERLLPIVRERLYIWQSGTKHSPLFWDWEQIQERKRFADL